jgi:hypothetical protein
MQEELESLKQLIHNNQVALSAIGKEVLELQKRILKLEKKPKKRTIVLDGIPFSIYGRYDSLAVALWHKEQIQQEGYYVRKRRTKDKIEIWASLNPRWFFRGKNLKEKYNERRI